jgi:hypothetical protein
MSNGSSLSLDELQDRIAIVRDNIRQLVEQAVAFSGAEDEARNANRIAEQSDELQQLIKQRDAMLKQRKRKQAVIAPQHGLVWGLPHVQSVMVA